MNRVYGKRRAMVTDNEDPLRLGRVQVQCPAVMGEHSLWAMPCVPYAGPGVGIVALPPVGASVWVEFEDGDPSLPIWVGCFWKDDELPEAWTQPSQKVIAVEGVTLIADAEAGWRLEVDAPASDEKMQITCEGSSMKLALGSATIELSAQGVNVNDGALEVL